MIMMKFDLQRTTARYFVESKGRMPNNRDELAEWLIEFTQHMARMLDQALKNYDEHMMVCNRPIIMTREQK